MWFSSKIIPLQSREAINFRLDTEGAAASLLIMVVVTGHAAAASHGADRDGLLPMTVCIQDKWSRADASMGCRGRGFADGLQTSASRHKWAMVYDIKNCELRTSLHSVIAVRFDFEMAPRAGTAPFELAFSLAAVP